MRRSLVFVLVAPMLMLMMSTASPASAQPTWTETTSADFGDGIFDNTEVVSDDVRLAGVPADAWTQATPAATWSKRYCHTSVVYDGKMWIIGGYDGIRKENDVWYSADGVNWTQATPAAAWSKRYCHASVVYDGKMWVIGGHDGTLKNDVWYSTDGVNWTQATSAAAWSGRCGHTSVVHGGKMWVIGGWDGTRKNDVWYSADGENWIRATSAAAWSGRDSHTSVVYDGKMWVIGGLDGTRKNDVWYSADGVTWARATSAAAWSVRPAHTSVVYDGKMWIIGGFDGAYKNDVWYSADGENWIRATSAAAWSGRNFHTSVVYDGKMWVIGGLDGTLKNDVWCWAPYRDSGTYISSDHDTGVNDMHITQVSWTATGLTLTLEVAAGNSPNPTNWEPVTNPDTSVAVTGRYIRYRATFSGTGLSDDPELEDVTITYALPTSLTCNVDNSTPAPGQEIGFSGYLRDSSGAGVGGNTIHLYKNGFDTGLTTTTHADGYYGILTNASGIPRVDNYYTRFAGDASYFSSKSPTVSVTVIVPTYRVFGWVRSEGVPVAGAQLTLDGRSTTADENGYYEFTGLEGNKSYNLTVSASGYGVYTKTTSIGAADERANIDLVKEAKAPILLIAIVIAVIGCIVGGLIALKKRRSRK